MAVGSTLLTAGESGAETDLRTAIHRLGNREAIEGRLAESLGLPLNTLTGAQTRTLRQRIRHEIAQRPATAPQITSYRGLIALYEGRLDEARASFETVAQNTGDWRAWNDLAVVHLEGARRSNGSMDLLHALNAIGRANELAPERHEVLFNRALVLSKLHLPQSAARAWLAFLDSISLPGEDLDREAWVARWYLHLASRPPRQQRFEQRIASLADPSSRHSFRSLEDLAGEFPDLLRSHAERQLAQRWSESILSGDYARAEQIQKLGAAIGAVLARTRGDYLVLDLFTGLDMCSRDLDQGRDCAGAALGLGLGAAALEIGDVEQAAAWLTRAAGETAGDLIDPPLQEYYLCMRARGVTPEPVGRAQKQGLSPESFLQQWSNLTDLDDEACSQFVRFVWSGRSTGSDHRQPTTEDHRRRLPGALGFLAKYYRACLLAQRGDLNAQKEFERQLTPAIEQRYPTLAGWLHWRLGLLQISQAHNQNARDHFLRGQELVFAGSGYHDSVYAENLLAEAFDLMGDLDRAWSSRITLLRVFAYSGDAQVTRAILTSAVLGLLTQGEVEAADAFLEELVGRSVDSSWPRELLSIPAEMAHLVRARYILATVASSDQSAAYWQRRLQQWIPGWWIVRPTSDQPVAVRTPWIESPSDDSDSTRWYRRSASVAEILSLDPSVANRWEISPLGHLGSSGRLVCTLLVSELRAQKLEAGGDQQHALIQWQNALGFREAQRATIEDHSRAIALRRAQVGYDSIVEILLRPSPLADAAMALTVSERSRGRYVLDLLSNTRGQESLPLTAEQIIARVPAGTALVEYAVLEEQLIAWVVQGQSLRLVQQQVAAEELGRLVARLWGDLEARMPEAVLAADTAMLFDVLIEPLALELDGLNRVIFVPDRELTRVPFPALFDRRAGRYLIEVVAVATAPSASLFTRPAPLLEERGGPGLIVVAPDLSGTNYGHLPPLPGAHMEADGVLEVYPAAMVLAGKAATLDAVLAALRDSSFLHFAGHAVANDDKAFGSELLLTPSGEHPSPMSIGELVGDGFVAPPVVVLAACSTADGFEVDREGRLGLAAGFIASGSRAVLSTLWIIEDDKAPPLLVTFHRALNEGMPPSSAWRRAVLAQLRRPEASLRTWAAFTLFEVAEQESVLWAQSKKDTRGF